MHLRNQSALLSAPLADDLRRGPLPLPAALRYATEIAFALRGIHDGHGAHGAVNADSVRMDGDRVILAPADRAAPASDRTNDIAAFGALIYRMLTGQLPPSGTLAPPPPRAQMRSSAEGIHNAALRLACRCINRQPGLEIRTVLTELRTLSLLARYIEPGLATRAVAMPASAEPPSPGDSPAGDPAPVDVLCPRCASQSVYYSTARGPFESLLCWLGIPICRCHRCFFRYFVFLGIKVHKGVVLE